MRSSTLVLAALLLPVWSSAQTRTDAKAAAVAPGSPVRLPVGTTSGLTEWRTGRALHWAADTLFLVTPDGDTVAVPRARTSGLMTLIEPRHRGRNSLLAGVIGAVIGAGIAATTFEPVYGSHAENTGQALGCAIFVEGCNLPVRQLNSKADRVRGGLVLGGLVGYLVGRVASHSRWEPFSGAEVSASVGPSGTGLRLSAPTR